MKKHFVILLSVSLSLFMVIAAGCKKGEQPPEAPTAVVPEKAPEVKESSDYFQKAYDSFVKKDLGAAASDIKAGAEILRTDAEQATAEGKKALMKSVDELEQLAKDVETGVAVSDERLKGTFARAEHALAENNYLNASKEWTQQKTKETGNALEKAASHLEKAAEWAGTALSIGTADAIKNARAIAGNLMQNVGVGYEDVGEGIKILGAEIAKTGKGIESKNK